MPFLDTTGIFALEQIIADFKTHGAQVLLVELRPNVRYKLERVGLLAQVGADNVIDTLELAMARAQQLQTAARSRAAGHRVV
jgi:SulP family sulfate permease